MKRIDSFDVRINLEKTGENIKKLIQDSGFSIVEIQKMLHLESVQSIYKWRAGRLPSIDNLMYLSLIFEVPIDEIIVKESTASSATKESDLETRED